ncbi:MAG TPA: ornithine cyclodeaminase family protein [Steroidobacteraceae bacterium]|nr:ornithine cyclodeaminase family protein [Steroidobacteraceae bacterium]
MLDKTQVEALLEPAGVLEAVRQAFILHSKKAGRLFPVVREALPSGAVFGIKSGDAENLSLLGLKAAGFWPDNRDRGGEPHQATILLFDPETGRPNCVIDGNAVTTLRTGAAGALGLLHLARADSSDVCVFGTGVQARVQLAYALQVLPALRTTRYVTGDGRPDTGFESDFSHRCRLMHVFDRNTAVAASDVIITATPGNGSLFDLEAVRPGTHLNCIGTDTEGKRELPHGLLAKARLYVDDSSQARRIGETQWAPGTPCTELGDIVAAATTAPRQASDVTVFDMTGIALQDLTVTRMLLDRACAAGIGTRISWPW